MLTHIRVSGSERAPSISSSMDYGLDYYMVQPLIIKILIRGVVVVSYKVFVRPLSLDMDPQKGSGLLEQKRF